MDCASTVALDFNPLLLLVAKAVSQGERLTMYEFPIAPKSLEDDAVLRTLSAPNVAGEGFEFVLGDALRPPFASDRSTRSLLRGSSTSLPKTSPCLPRESILC